MLTANGIRRNTALIWTLKTRQERISITIGRGHFSDSAMQKPADRMLSIQWKIFLQCLWKT